MMSIGEGGLSPVRLLLAVDGRNDEDPSLELGSLCCSLEFKNRATLQLCLRWVVLLFLPVFTDNNGFLYVVFTAYFEALSGCIVGVLATSSSRF